MSIDDVTGLGVQAGQITVGFDPDILMGGDPVRDGTLLESGQWLVASFVDSTLGQYRVAFAGVSELAGGGQLLRLQFRVAAEAEPGTVSLSWLEAELNEGAIAATALPGAIEVIGQASSTDFDGSGDVDFDDFFLFADHFGSIEGDADFDPIFDLDGSGAIDFPDFFRFADAFGT